MLFPGAERAQECVVNAWFDMTLPRAAEVGNGPKNCYYQPVKDFLWTIVSGPQVVPGLCGARLSDQLWTLPGLKMPNKEEAAYCVDLALSAPLKIKARAPLKNWMNLQRN